MSFGMMTAWEHLPEPVPCTFNGQQRFVVAVNHGANLARLDGPGVEYADLGALEEPEKAPAATGGPT